MLCLLYRLWELVLLVNGLGMELFCRAEIFVSVMKILYQFSSKIKKRPYSEHFLINLFFIGITLRILR